MIISNFIAYAIQTWKNKPDTSTPLSAARLAHIEAGIKANSDAITKLAAAVINQQANDVNKIPSSALMYSVNEKVDSAISDLGNVKTKFPGDTKQVVFNYDDSATIGLHIPTNRFRLSLQRNSQWLGLLPIISTNPTGAIEFGQITLTKNNTTGNYDLHLYDIKGTWICKFTSTLS